MFEGTTSLSDCNKVAIDGAFTKNDAWSPSATNGDDWSDLTCTGTFANKAELQAALELVVCDGDADALALYGAPDTWDVSAVTDMSYLIGGYGNEDATRGLSCKATFNEVHP